MADSELDSSPATSLSTSLLSSDLDAISVEYAVPPFRVPPPHPPPLHPEPDRGALRRSAVWAFAGFLAVLLLPTLLLSPPQVGTPPTSRKAASMGFFAGDTASLLSKSPPPRGLNDTQEVLIVWAGMGHRRTLLSDAFAFDLRTRRWTKVLSGKKAGKEPQPDARWKAASTASTAPPGMLVLFGDNSGRFNDSKPTNMSYESDVWVLNTPSLRWEAAAAGAEGLAAPAARRGHAAAVIPSTNNAITQQKQRIVVFGGALPNQTDLADTWVASVAWPAVSWTHVGADSLQTPPARRGHTATVLEAEAGGAEEGEGPAVAVFGGRDETQFFNDLWILKNLDGIGDDGDAVWERVEPVYGSPAPPPRAHHAAVVWRGRLHIWGGLSGPTFAAAKPLDDLWVFDFNTKRWTKAIGAGAQPLPRFLFSSTAVDGGGTAPRLYIFGGETYDRCKLNDVWALNLETLHWELLAPAFFQKARCDRLFGRSGGRPGRRRLFF